MSEWFDDYIAGEEADPGDEPELHKGMVLLLARCWDYRLKTEDVLELCQGNRRIALCTVRGPRLITYQFLFIPTPDSPLHTLYIHILTRRSWGYWKTGKRTRRNSSSGSGRAKGRWANGNTNSCANGTRNR